MSGEAHTSMGGIGGADIQNLFFRMEMSKLRGAKFEGDVRDKLLNLVFKRLLDRHMDMQGIMDMDHVQP